jgi:hypothetical protein
MGKMRRLRTRGMGGGAMMWLVVQGRQAVVCDVRGNMWLLEQ